MRAREPDRVGYVERDGVRVGYEVFGSAGPAIIFLPSWQILHSRQWKLQAPYLARYMRVITYDARGNGRSDRPAQAERYAHREIVADAVAVLDAVGVDEAVFAGTSMGALYGLQAAAWYPERVRAVVAIGSVAPYVAPVEPGASPFYDVGAAGSVAAFCAQRGLPDYRAFVEYFMGEAITEPHRTKPVEDAVGWGLETTPEVLALTVAAREGSRGGVEDVCRAVRCPVLVVHGDEDGIIPYETVWRWPSCGRRAGHARGRRPRAVAARPGALQPVDPGVRRALVARGRRRRAPGPGRCAGAGGRSYLSSPIGLGHARRDVAIADELRALHPDLEIDWLAQHPVTGVLDERGERVHPASALLASGVGAHRVRGGRARPARLPGAPADGRDPGRQLHGLPRPGPRRALRPRGSATRPGTSTTSCTRTRSSSAAPFAWLTDFVGWLPMPDGGAAEAALTADYNAEMIEQIARYPRLRDRSIFVGNPDDVVDRPVRAGPAEHARTGRPRTSRSPATSPAAAAVADRAALRARAGLPARRARCAWWPSAGPGSAAPLLRRVVDAFPHAGRAGARAADGGGTGPRIDPASVPRAAGRRGARLRARAAPAPGRVRPRRRAGRADHDDGARPPRGGPSSTSRCATTSSSRSTCPTGSRGTAPGGGWTTPTATRSGSPRRSPPSSTRPVDYRPVETDGAAPGRAMLAELL